MYGSNFYGSHVSIFPKNWPLNYDASAEFFTTSFGKPKCFIHVSKPETPLQNQYVLYRIEIDLKLIVPTVHTTYFSHGLFYRKSCQRIAS